MIGVRFAAAALVLVLLVGQTAAQVTNGGNSRAAPTRTTPTNPTGTTSTASFVMMGLSNQGGTQIPSFTPRQTGNVLITYTGNISNSTSSDGLNLFAVYGTGTAPTNGAAATGTQCTNTGGLTRVTTGTDSFMFTATCIAIGLTVGTTYWTDLQLKAVTGGTASVNNLTVSVAEL